MRKIVLFVTTNNYKYKNNICQMAKEKNKNLPYDKFLKFIDLFLGIFFTN